LSLPERLPARSIRKKNFLTHLQGHRVGDDGAAGPRSGADLYEFSLDEMIPTDHLLRRINVFAAAVLADLHHRVKAF
jgi:hypothetical protein